MREGQKVVDIKPDGTLVVYTRHYDAVKRIVIQYADKEPIVFLKKKVKPAEVVRND